MFADHFMPTDNVVLEQNSLVLNSGDRLVLFDTGNGKGRMPTAGNLVEGLAAAGYKPEQIDIVVVTHGHPDHIGGLMADGKPVYANARYVFGDVEFDFWKKGDVGDARKANRDQFMQVAVPFATVGHGVQRVPHVSTAELKTHWPSHACWPAPQTGWQAPARHSSLLAQA